MRIPFLFSNFQTYGSGAILNLRQQRFFKFVVCVLELVGEWLPVIVHLQFALESSDNNDLKRQNIDFVMRIPYLFSNFCSDVWFRRNIEYMTAAFILPPLLFPSPPLALVWTPPPSGQSQRWTGKPPPLWLYYVVPKFTTRGLCIWKITHRIKHIFTWYKQGLITHIISNKNQLRSGKKKHVWNWVRVNKIFV